MAKVKNTEDFIHHQNKTNTNETDKLYCYYTILGDHDFIDDENKPRSKTENEKVVAKTIIYNSRPTKYYIKIGAHGQLFNPIGMYSEGNNNKFITKIGRKAWEFKEVNQKIFDLYGNFLTTKNIAWLNNAEREMF